MIVASVPLRELRIAPRVNRSGAHRSSHGPRRSAVGMIHNRFRGRDGARVIGDRLHTIAFCGVAGKDRDQNIAAAHLPLVLDCFDAAILMPMIDLVNLPATAPTPAPAKVAMMGPAAISGPTPGIASIPRAIRQLKVPPRTMPLPPPTAAPQGLCCAPYGGEAHVALLVGQKNRDIILCKACPLELVDDTACLTFALGYTKCCSFCGRLFLNLSLRFCFID
jgi:hypothetical protein